MLKFAQTASASNCLPVNVDGMTSPSRSTLFTGALDTSGSAQSGYFKNRMSKKKHFGDFKSLNEHSGYSRQK